MPEGVRDLLLAEFGCYPIYGKLLVRNTEKNIKEFGGENEGEIIAFREAIYMLKNVFYDLPKFIEHIESGDISGLTPCQKEFLKSAITADYWYLVARAELGRFTEIPEQQTDEFRLGYLAVAKRTFEAYECVKKGGLDNMCSFPYLIPPKSAQELFCIGDIFWIQNFIAELNRRTLPIPGCERSMVDIRNLMFWPNAPLYLTEYATSIHLNTYFHHVPMSVITKIVGLSCLGAVVDFTEVIAIDKQTEFLLGDIYDVGRGVRRGFLNGERALIDNARRFIIKFRRASTW